MGKRSLRLLALLFAMLSSQATPTPFYLGTYSDNQPGRGIFRGTLDTATGELGPIELAAEANNPSYLCLSPDGQTLYAVSESKEPMLNAYAVAEDGSLTLINSQIIDKARGACHVSTDPAGKVVLVANYGSGTVDTFLVREDGSLDEKACHWAFFGSGPNPKRQLGSHAHCAVTSPDGQHAYVVDLGADKIHIFNLDGATGQMTLSKTPVVGITPGGGPRHIVFNASGRHAWVNHEMGLAVTSFVRDSDTGSLSPIATTAMRSDAEAPTEGITSSAILLHPSEKFLYVTSRGDDTIAVFSIAEDGSLTLIESAPAMVSKPRGAAIDPTGRWLLVGGQDDATLSVFAIDLKNGTLKPTGRSTQVPKPVCLVF